ncbi:DUF4157 domain-containing protein [Paucibacter sp. APW11]|uniref:DUF4157 domain-containing protein n=1 Tax=Roseateles aquae TaxID=3077235 RepID=A0ABU3P6K6_9BURK|nr:DUF4157 domain-containing protein [Paucibacter sp. APW11]MDT8998194.1 DUF4157 domain-containing protein [Paucibacter sp. APW11]
MADTDKQMRAPAGPAQTPIFRAAALHSQPFVTGTASGRPAQQQHSPRMVAQRRQIHSLSVAAQRASDERPAAASKDLPAGLKAGVEALSGLSMDHVQVHYNSAQPAQLNARAYAQGSQIHLAPGQQQHLPHEAWHLVQQAQGRVRPTMQMKPGLAINDDAGLEREATQMGAKALAAPVLGPGALPLQAMPARAGDAAAPVQRVLTLDNADFSEVNQIRKLGGAAEGAYLVSDGDGEVVVKIAEGIDGTVLAYNLAKDFGVATPKGRHLTLDSDAGRALLAKAETLSPELFGKLTAASSVTLWSMVRGQTLGQLGTAVGGEQGAIEGEANFQQIGRMLVFDAAILNEDRFKLAFNLATNAGNLMVQDRAPVAIDQDFANIDKDPDSSRNEQIDNYGEMMASRLQALLADPDAMASALCKKLSGEGYKMFAGQEAPIAAGIRQGIAVLRTLAADDNQRLPTLIGWAKTFDASSDVDAGKVKSYWRSLLAD